MVKKNWLIVSSPSMHFANELLTTIRYYQRNLENLITYFLLSFFYVNIMDWRPFFFSPRYFLNVEKQRHIHQMKTLRAAIPPSL